MGHYVAGFTNMEPYYKSAREIVKNHLRNLQIRLECCVSLGRLNMRRDKTSKRKHMVLTSTSDTAINVKHTLQGGLPLRLFNV